MFQKTLEHYSTEHFSRSFFQGVPEDTKSQILEMLGKGVEHALWLNTSCMQNLYSAYKCHVFEIMLKTVLNTSSRLSPSPDIFIFKQFPAKWHRSIMAITALGCSEFTATAVADVTMQVALAKKQLVLLSTPRQLRRALKSVAPLGVKILWRTLQGTVNGKSHF